MHVSINNLKTLRHPDGFAAVDLYFADFIAESAHTDSPYLYLAAALCCFAQRQSEVCLDIGQWGNRVFPDYETGEGETLVLPAADDWLRDLRSGRYDAVLSADPETPLVLDDDGRLYLQRYFLYETRLAGYLLAKLNPREAETEISNEQIRAVSRYFTGNDFDEDRQQQAVRLALDNRLAVITGGPGTGKTTVVAAILALKLMRNPHLKIAVCAPTGKAQARLKEAIVDECENLTCPADVITRLRDIPATTIHSLLGVRHNTPEFRHDRTHPLHIDLLVVDEASMVALPLMSRLLAAVPGHAPVILLGDKDQLASVEAGAVLADMVDSRCLLGHKVELTRSYRFDDSRGIGKVKRAMNAGDAEGAWRQAVQGDEQFVCRPSPTNEKQLRFFLERLVAEETLARNGRTMAFKSYKKLLGSERPEDIRAAWEMLAGLKILCACRRGLHGVETVNRLMLDILGFGRRADRAGIPVMITRNDRSVNLFNGDIGVIWDVASGETDAEGQPVKSRQVYFPAPDGGLVAHPYSSLPPHEVVFAMTIHKSQGSGFDRVVAMLPDRTSPLLTRELLYTAVTRARKHVTLLAGEKIFKQAVTSKTLSASGLRDRLDNAW